MWNSISNRVVYAQSINTFKTRLDKLYYYSFITPRRQHTEYTQYNTMQCSNLLIPEKVQPGKRVKT